MIVLTFVRRKYFWFQERACCCSTFHPSSSSQVWECLTFPFYQNLIIIIKLPSCHDSWSDKYAIFQIPWHGWLSPLPLGFCLHHHRSCGFCLQVITWLPTRQWQSLTEMMRITLTFDGLIHQENYFPAPQCQWCSYLDFWEGLPNSQTLCSGLSFHRCSYLKTFNEICLQLTYLLVHKRAQNAKCSL